MACLARTFLSVMMFCAFSQVRTGGSTSGILGLTAVGLLIGDSVPSTSAGAGSLSVVLAGVKSAANVKVRLLGSLCEPIDRVIAAIMIHVCCCRLFPSGVMFTRLFGSSVEGSKQDKATLKFASYLRNMQRSH